MFNDLTKKSFLWIFALTIGTFFVQMSNAQTSSLSCQTFFSNYSNVDGTYNLFWNYQNETALKSREEIIKLNELDLKSIQLYHQPKSNLHKASALPLAVAVKLLEIVKSHPVVGFQVYKNYQQENNETGFCFGRAMYLHLTLLKLGLQKESIRKIWAVGSMRNMDGTSWDYHVATTAFVEKIGWMVLDPNFYRPLTLAEWELKMSEKSTDMRLRFYISEASRFGPVGGKYNPSVLGLKLPLEKDWYKHYFVNMNKSIASEKLEDLGLKHLVKIPKEKQSEIKKMISNIFEEVIQLFK